MTSKAACEVRFANILEDLDVFMYSRNMPPGNATSAESLRLLLVVILAFTKTWLAGFTELRGQIHDYYKAKFPSKQVFDEQAVIEDIESPSIKRDIGTCLFSCRRGDVAAKTVHMHKGSKALLELT